MTFARAGSARRFPVIARFRAARQPGQAAGREGLPQRRRGDDQPQGLCISVEHGFDGAAAPDASWPPVGLACMQVAH
jgi:hypothetical protein